MDIKGFWNFLRMPTRQGSEIVPAGGTTDQVLTKQSGTDYDYDWGDGGGVSAAANIVDNSIVRGDGGAKGIQDSEQGTTTWTIADDGHFVGEGNRAGYLMELRNLRTPSGGNGFAVMAGESLGDIAFHIADEDDTFQIMEMEADQGFITCGKTYAQTLTDNGVVYGFDIQHTGSAQDFNTQIGRYRLGGNLTMRTDWYQNAASESESSRTTDSYAQKLRLTTPSLPVGLYRIGYSCETRQSSSSGSVEVQVQINDSVTIANFEEEPDASTNIMPNSGFVYYSAGAGVLNIDMDYRRQQGTGTAYIRRARLEIWRVN